LGLGVVASSLLVGCGAPVPGDTDAADGAEELGRVQEGVIAHDVGVVPFDGQACPAGTEVSFRLDVEDHEDENILVWVHGSRNGGYITDWVDRDMFWDQAPITTNMFGGNFSMRFCRVDGNQFGRLLWSNQATSYAVLQLSQTCPDGAFSVSRYMDMEDEDNTNSSSGSLSPSVITAMPVSASACSAIRWAATAPS